MNAIVYYFFFQLIQLANDPNYLHRMICLAALRELGEAEICHPEMLPKSLLPTIAQLSTDAVPNVRFKVSVSSVLLAAAESSPLGDSSAPVCLATILKGK